MIKITYNKDMLFTAESGDSEAQHKLGLCYEFGYGINVDYEKAFSWYKLSADQGNTDAEVNLGSLYEDGAGVAQDYNEALRLYYLAAKKIIL